VRVGVAVDVKLALGRVAVMTWRHRVQIDARRIKRLAGR
jgi:hypothetical protein